jgi:predicted CopG family antitoxin
MPDKGANSGRKADEHIRVTERNQWRLRRLKTGGDSFNDVVGRLLDAAEDDLQPDFDGNDEEVEGDGGEAVTG